VGKEGRKISGKSPNRNRYRKGFPKILEEFRAGEGDYPGELLAGNRCIPRSWKSSRLATRHNNIVEA
jgi:hypothetical protein